MKSFLINLALLVVIGIVLSLMFPDIVKQIFGIYNGLGILPIFLLMVVVAALPRRKKGRRSK